ncbi:MAG: carbohydrate ABC transporter permease [Mycetocola sp.]
MSVYADPQAPLTRASETVSGPRRRGPGRTSKLRRRPNWLAGLGGWLWLAIIILPIYYVVITSFKDQASFFSGNPLAPPTSLSFDNYALVLENNFLQYFTNSILVTVGSVVPILLVTFMASYAIVRGRSRFLNWTNTLFLLGLAVPIQATIIPIYLMISRAGLYDSLLALILPSVAFAIPLSVIILNNFMRNVPEELFESMRLDGCNDWQMLWRLAFPLIRPALVTVAIYQGLQVWNSFLFPLVLTQSPGTRVLPLSLWMFQGEFTVNIPAVLASVVLSTLPLLVLYIVGRKQLLGGLTAGIGK